MTYPVVWVPSAEAELARIWVEASDKNAVARAADQIDATLRVDPHVRGVPHLGTARSLAVWPLGIIFRVNEPDRLVQVLAVVYHPSHTGNGKP
jgi:hypothetical protein